MKYNEAISYVLYCFNETSDIINIKKKNKHLTFISEI